MKDPTSFIAHNKDYENYYNLEKSLEIVADYDKNNLFSTLGFEKALTLFTHRETHVDIGTGSGWLLRKTSPLFKKVYGIEPSIHAVNTAKEILKDSTNVEIIVSDMIEGVRQISPKKSTFFTTAVVLSHIKDTHVKDFLIELNNAPRGSTLFFDERYDKNIQQKLWHIRRKYWWAKHLPHWQLTFFELNNGGYKSGIYGERVGKENVKSHYTPSIQDHLQWQIDGIRQKLLRIGRNAVRTLRKLIGTAK